MMNLRFFLMTYAALGVSPARLNKSPSASLKSEALPSLQPCCRLFHQLALIGFCSPSFVLLLPASRLMPHSFSRIGVSKLRLSKR
jgi:hypothetical protein